MMKLDLACGGKVQPGFLGVDKDTDLDVDYHVDLEQYPWPWADSSVDDIWCSHYVEHTHSLQMFMNECHRILKPGEQMTIVHPYAHSNRAWQDPTHVRALNEDSWRYYSKRNRDATPQSSYLHITADLEIYDIHYLLANGAIVHWESTDVFTMDKIRHQVNIVDDLVVRLVKQ